MNFGRRLERMTRERKRDGSKIHKKKTSCGLAEIEIGRKEWNLIREPPGLLATRASPEKLSCFQAAVKKIVTHEEHSGAVHWEQQPPALSVPYQRASTCTPDTRGAEDITIRNMITRGTGCLPSPHRPWRDESRGWATSFVPTKRFTVQGVSKGNEREGDREREREYEPWRGIVPSSRIEKHQARWKMMSEGAISEIHRRLANARRILG